MRSKNKAKKRQIQHLATRTVVEVDRYYDCENYQEEEPEGGYVEETVSWTKRVYPPAPRISTRIPPRKHLSRGQLRRRLSASGLRGTRSRQAVDEIKAGPGSYDSAVYGGYRVLNWPEKLLKERLGRRLFRAVTRFVLRIMIILDEFGYYASEGFAVIAGMTISRGFVLAPGDTQSVEKLQALT